MRVFVLDKNGKPLDPCNPVRARKLLKAGRAAVIRRYPFTIILKDRTVEASVVYEHRVKIDPGSKVTGLANAIAHVQANEARHPNRGLANALAHLKANQAKKAAKHH